MEMGLQVLEPNPDQGSKMSFEHRPLSLSALAKKVEGREENQLVCFYI